MKRKLLTLGALLMGSILARAEDDIAGWVRDLGAEDSAVRDAADEKLLAAGEAARPALEAALNSPDPEVSSRAKSLLGRLGEPGAPTAPLPKPKVKGRQTQGGRMAMTMVIVSAEGRTTVTQGMNGSVKVVEEIKGETKEYEAPTREEFREKYPEVAKKYGLDTDEQGLTFGKGRRIETPENEELQKVLERIEKEALERERELLKKLRERRDGNRDDEDDPANQPEEAKEVPGTGVAIEPMDEALRYQLDLPKGGVTVVKVRPDSRAAALGLQPLDILLSLNGVSVQSEADLGALLASKSGATAEIVRDGERKSLKLDAGD